MVTFLMGDLRPVHEKHFRDTANKEGQAVILRLTLGQYKHTKVLGYLFRFPYPLALLNPYNLSIALNQKDRLRRMAQDFFGRAPPKKMPDPSMGMGSHGD